MRRRRQKNPLLKRIILISIGVHIAVLPVLAHFNAFQKIQKGLVQVQMVVLAPPDREPPKPEEKQKKTATKQTPTAKKNANATAHHHTGPIRIAKNSPHIAVANGNGTGEEEAGTAVQGDAGQGKLPTPGADKGTTTPKSDNGGGGGGTVVKPAPMPDPKPTPPTPTAVATKPPVSTPVTTPVPVAPSRQAVFTEASPIGEQPTPDIPDDLRTEALDKTFVAECMVSSEGAVKEIKTTQSTGNDELDRRAIQAAKRWKFKPATRDGVPTESRVRLHIQFQVSA